MGRSVACPRCHLQLEDRAADGAQERRCPACGSPLVPASIPREAAVRKFLHGHRLIPLPRPFGGGRVRMP